MIRCACISNGSSSNSNTHYSTIETCSRRWCYDSILALLTAHSMCSLLYHSDWHTGRSLFRFVDKTRHRRMINKQISFKRIGRSLEYLSYHFFVVVIVWKLNQPISLVQCLVFDYWISYWVHFFVMYFSTLLIIYWTIDE